MKVFAAFGGWGLDSGFSEEAATGDMSALAQRFVDFADANALYVHHLYSESPKR
jgi:hypothetical protein